MEVNEMVERRGTLIAAARAALAHGFRGLALGLLAEAYGIELEAPSPPPALSPNGAKG